MVTQVKNAQKPKGQTHQRKPKLILMRVAVVVLLKGKPKNLKIPKKQQRRLHQTYLLFSQ